MEELLEVVTRMRRVNATRIVAIGGRAVILFGIIPSVSLLGWLALHLVLMLTGAVLFTEHRIETLYQKSRLRRYALPYLVVQSCCVALICLLAGLSHQSLGLPLAVGTAGGYLTSAILLSGRSRDAFIASAAPVLICLGLIIPAALIARGGNLVDALKISALGFVSIASTAVFWRRFSGLLNAEASARAEADAANVAKSQFLATMSHEIRTPLNGILGMTQAMAAGDLNAAQRDKLEIISQSGSALLAILNDVLDLSKIEAGKLEIEKVEFDLGDVARGAYAAFTGIANGKGLSFCLDMEGARGTYLGDPTRIRQILYNLISNALKFTESGEIRVTLTVFEGMLQITVADTGIGISPEQASQLFERFNQADGTTTRRFGGTGLGLAICRHLAQAMGGTITLESEPGRGSAFTVLLNVDRVGEERAAAGFEPAPNLEAVVTDLGEFRVLAAEDNHINQLVLNTLLQQVGIRPTIVGDGVMALEAWEQQDWDIILMDVQMPNMDGPSATRQIRRREIETGRRRTPILALTANTMTHQVDAYIEVGFDGHVGKPIQVDALLESLDRLLSPEEPGEAPLSQVA